MKLCNLVIGSILLALPVPALAQYAGNPPQYSSPAELAATRALNGRAMDGTCAPPAVLNGQVPPDAARRMPDRCQRYEARLQRYQENRRDYEMRMRAYRRSMARYREMRRRWYEEQAEY